MDKTPFLTNHRLDTKEQGPDFFYFFGGYKITTKNQGLINQEWRFNHANQDVTSTKWAINQWTIGDLNGLSDPIWPRTWWYKSYKTKNRGFTTFVVSLSSWVVFYTPKTIKELIERGFHFLGAPSCSLHHFLLVSEAMRLGVTYDPMISECKHTQWRPILLWLPLKRNAPYIPNLGWVV